MITRQILAPKQNQVDRQKPRELCQLLPLEFRLPQNLKSFPNLAQRSKAVQKLRLNLQSQRTLLLLLKLLKRQLLRRHHPRSKWKCHL